MPTPDLFQEMFALSAQHASSVTRQEGKLSYRAGVVRGKNMLIVFTQSRMPSRKQLEETGEDAGFYDPYITPHPISNFPKAVLIQEGLKSVPCKHQFGTPTHFDSRLSYGLSHNCQKCGVNVGYEGRRRGKKTTFLYDYIWELREHIWEMWSIKGPTPGSLQEDNHR